ncbi:MAG TPA: M24 family metallopeptidase [Acidobacteriota bacterium]|nr:M24 family metallopeptidase [Acidobacteriota bacterium]
MQLRLTAAVLAMAASGPVLAQEAGIALVDDAESILPRRQQAILMNALLEEKQRTILPQVMRENSIDMWIVSEGDGPLYVSLLESEADGAVLETPPHLVFFDRGEGADIERLMAESDDLAEIVRTRSPDRIAIGGGRSRRSRRAVAESERAEVAQRLGDDLASRVVPAATLANHWLGTRTSREQSVFRHVLRLAHEIIAEAFSNRVIIPDVTTTDDVNWWIRQRYADLGLGTVDHPTITVQRSKAERAKYADDDEYFRVFDERFVDDPSPRVGLNVVIRRGDLIFCDTGIMYLGLYTDTQQSGYVLRDGEDEPPEGIQEAMRHVLRFQDLIGEEMRLGRGGNEIGIAAVERAREEGIQGNLYAHSLAYYFMRYGILGRFFSDEVHSGGSGLSSGRGRGDGGRPLRHNTLFALELDIQYELPEWDGQRIVVFSETGMTFTPDGMVFPGGRETEWLVIR